MAGLLDFLLNGQGGGVLPPFAQNFGAGDPGNASPATAPDTSQAYAQAPQQVAQAAPQYAQPQMPQMAQAPQIGPPRMSGLAGLFAAMNPQAGQAYYQRMMMQQMYQAMTTPKSAGGLGLPPAQALVAMQSPDAMKLLGGVPIKLDPYETPGGYKGSQIYTANGPQTLYPTPNGQAPADLSARTMKPGERVVDFSKPAGIGAAAVGPQSGGAPQQSAAAGPQTQPGMQGQILGENNNGLLDDKTAEYNALRWWAGDKSAAQAATRGGELGQINNVKQQQWIQRVGAQLGKTPDDIAAAQGGFENTVQANKNFGTGKQGDTVRSFSVFLDHAQLFRNLAQAMNNGDYPAINALRNVWREQMGSPLPTNLNAAKQVLSAELAKAVQGGDVAEQDRHQLQEALHSSNSWQQLSGAIDNVFIPLGAGQIRGLMQQYVQNTKRTPGDFYRLLSDRARSVFVPPKAVEALKAQPKLASEFDAKYGKGVSNIYLGQ